MEFLELLREVLGVNLAHFAIVSAVIMVIVFLVRLGVKGMPFAQLNWFKAVLAAGAIVLGIGAAYLAVSAGIYVFKNHALVVFVGFFNGALASVGWSLLKQIPGLKALVEGLSETTEKPADSDPPDEPEVKVEDDPDDINEETTKNVLPKAGKKIGG